MQHKHALKLLNTINRTGGVVVRGTAGLVALREAVSLAMKRGGLSIAFDQESDAELTDYLVVGGISALDQALWGAVVGALAGAVIGRPAVGLAVGLAIGASSGTLRGIDLVRRGWRISALRDLAGAPIITVTAEP